jgi:hypothetical protein
MNDLSVDDLKEVLAYYKDKSSNLEFEMLRYKLEVIKNIKYISELKQKVIDLDIEKTGVIEQLVALNESNNALLAEKTQKKTSTKKTK